MNRGLVSDCCIIIQTTVNRQMSFLPSSWLTHPLTNWLSPMIVEALPETYLRLHHTVIMCYLETQRERKIQIKYLQNNTNSKNISSPRETTQHNHSRLPPPSGGAVVGWYDKVPLSRINSCSWYLCRIYLLKVSSLSYYCTEYSPRCRFVGLVVGRRLPHHQLPSMHPFTYGLLLLLLYEIHLSRDS